jgi:hypothetical protein
MKSPVFSRLFGRSGALSFTVFATLVPTWLLGSIFGVAVSEIWSQHRESDRLLFRDGGALLLESVRSSMPFLRGVGTLTGPTLAALTFVSLFVWSGLLDALARPVGTRLRPSEFAAATTRYVGNFAAIFAVTLLLRAALIGVTIFLVQGIAPAIARDASERGRTFAAVGAALVGWGLLEGLRLLQDLTTVVCVRHDASLASAGLSALGVFRDRFARLVLRKGVYFLASSLVVAVAVLAPTSFWEQRFALFARVGIHQLALAALVVLRAAWLTFLLEEIGPKRPAWSEALSEVAPVQQNDEPALVATNADAVADEIVQPAEASVL